MRPFHSLLAAAAVLTLVALPAGAQDVSATAETTSTTSADATGPANAAISDRYMTAVHTELTSRIDSKNAAVGQQVTAKTTEAATLADGTKLPKGTKLIGHVSQVQAQSNTQLHAVLAMTFDQAELKGGQTLPLRSAIRAVAPPVHMDTSATSSLMADDPAMGAGASAAGMGSARGGGGGLGVGGGGALGGAVRGVGQTAGGAGRTAGSSVGETARTATSLDDAVATTSGGAVTQTGESVSAIPRATAMPGVMLATAGSANASGTLLASGRNISLESGTQLTLALIAR